MRISNLDDTPLEQIIACLLKSFEGYFVQMPESLDYWQQRFKSARVQFSHSAGAFDDQKLVGFIIHGIDTFEGIKRAFNTGTGVLPEYGGQRLVDQLYKHIIPTLKDDHIDSCCLEVIRENYKAISVYERIGFRKTRSYHCFKGTFKLDEALDDEHELLSEHIHYSWDNCDQALALFDKDIIRHEKIMDGPNVLGEIKWNTVTGQIHQCSKQASSHWRDVFRKFHGQNSRMINVDSSRTDLLSFLPSVGMENNIDQYFMEMDI